MTPPQIAPVSPQVSGERVITRAFEDAGAVSPATARPLLEVAGVDAAAVLPLVARRLVREGAPGRYYLHAGTEHVRRRTYVIALLVFLLLLLPVVLLQVTGRR